MPRRARVVLAGFPHHVVQRGHNGEKVFFGDGDRLFYLRNLGELKKDLECRVYAYCLMDNHVHMIVAPGDRSGSLSELMKKLAGRYAVRINHRSNRKGSLWEGRFKSSVIDTDRYLSVCSRYVEMNPVRAGIAASPAEFVWSSYAPKVGLRGDDFLDEDPFFRSLGTTVTERRNRYASWVLRGNPGGEIQFIRDAIRKQCATGDGDFIESLSKATGRCLGPVRRGRRQKSGTVPLFSPPVT